MDLYSINRHLKKTNTNEQPSYDAEITVTAAPTRLHPQARNAFRAVRLQFLHADVTFPRASARSGVRGYCHILRFKHPG